ncbi:MAG: hypothetical protein KC462_05345, partial [Cyanobacteria bacterium HKST-UBA05]|nr:hypothetical protein [Cyanobacteria bacterium HKST-UBA05]
MYVNPAIVSSLLNYTSQRPSPIPANSSPFGASTAYASDATGSFSPNADFNGFLDTLLKDLLNELINTLSQGSLYKAPKPVATPAPVAAPKPVPTPKPAPARTNTLNQALVESFIKEQQRQSRVLLGHGSTSTSSTSTINDRLKLPTSFTVAPTTTTKTIVADDLPVSTVGKSASDAVQFSSSKDKARVWGDPHYVTFQSQSFDYHGLKDETGEMVSYIDTPNVTMAAEFRPWGGVATVNGRVFTLIEDLDGTIHEVVMDPASKKVTYDGVELKDGEIKEFVLADIESKDGKPVKGFIKAGKNQAEFNFGQVAGNVEYAGGGKGAYSNLNFNVTDADQTYEINGIVGDQLDADYVRYENGGYFHDKNGDGKLQKEDGELTNLDTYVIDRDDEKATSDKDYLSALSTFANGENSLF